MEVGPETAPPPEGLHVPAVVVKEYRAVSKKAIKKAYNRGFVQALAKLRSCRRPSMWAFTQACQIHRAARLNGIDLVLVAISSIGEIVKVGKF